MNADKQGSSVVEEDDLKQFGEQILPGLIQGDEQAWHDFYYHFEGRLDSYFKGQGVKNKHDRENLLIETMAATFDSLLRYDPGGAPFHNWVYGIANNRLQKHWKATYSEMSEMEGAFYLATLSQKHEDGQSLNDVRTDQLIELEASLEKLSEKEQEIIQLRLGREHVPWRELAPEIGIGESAAKMRYMRAIERLKNLLEEKISM